jgi:hypothetical protein
MNPFTVAWRKLTYRNEYSTPDPADGLHVTAGRWGGRIVHDRHLAAALHARRMRLVQEGLDRVDLEAYLASHPAATTLLKTIADEVTARYVASYLSRCGNPSGQAEGATRSMIRAGS